jgi:hypothetical protein
LVVGGFRVGSFATAGFRVAIVLALVPLLFRAAVAAFSRTAGFFALVTVAPDDDETRDECLARWRTIVFGAASAIELTVKTATIAISNIFIVLRIIEVPPTGRAVTWFRVR